VLQASEPPSALSGFTNAEQSFASDSAGTFANEETVWFADRVNHPGEPVPNDVRMSLFAMRLSLPGWLPPSTRPLDIRALPRSRRQRDSASSEQFHLGAAAELGYS